MKLHIRNTKYIVMTLFIFIWNVRLFIYSYINHINSIFYFAMLNVAVCFAVLLCFCGQLRFDLSKPKAFSFYRRLRLLKRFKSMLDMFHYIILGAEFLATVFITVIFALHVTIEFCIDFTERVLVSNKFVAH